MTAPSTRRLRPTTVATMSSGRLGAPLLACWVAASMVVLVPVVVIGFTPTPHRPVWMGALAVTTIAGVRYAWIIGEGRRRLIEMSFWMFTYVFLGLAPLAQLRLEQNPPTTPRLDPSLDIKAMVIVVTGLVFFCVGLLVARLVWPKLPPIVTGERGAGRIDPLRAVALAVVALALNAYYISRIGLGTLFTSRTAVTEQAEGSLGQSTTAVIIAAGAMMSLLVAFIAVVKYYDTMTVKERAFLPIIILLGATLCVTLNPISNARYLFGTGALAVAALFGLFATRARFRVVAILAVAALVLVFPLADAFRYSSSAQFKTSNPLESLTSPDYDAFAQINNTVLYVQNNGDTGGDQALGVLFFWVPRSVWADKAPDTGVLLAQSRNYPVDNLSAPLWAELYINGGFPILVIGMLLFGLVAGLQDRRIEISLRTARAPTVLACILPFYAIILLRGSLLQAMSYLLVIIACALFVTGTGRNKV
ncbi:oligosaccharide repeat unit polymerase [Rhodococcus sp. SORGH_AS_0303]|uniref:oligosaccharide repeat unit polymerase n=1 Tax=Rhodococcus sp. SORGH_AS_0303 TaxID=3041753 RepID=UPI002780D65D|nr:oligosaccharide repeat unit polymerase [Rhodococcus sp. SORGH_AS_0303]MDQ1203277.1 oligosaccharide repeat unit polymerase [Rhodococcus sp. SORGH_AS_0303]